MPISASPAIQLSADGVTWLAPGAPLQVAPGATWYARLNSIGNVGSTTWAVLSTDDVGTAPALTSAGIASSTCSGVAGAAGTAFILQSTINGMVDPTTNTTNPLTTQATAKVWVPAANGNQVLCYDEHAEAGPQWWMPLVNAAIRGAAGGGGSQLQGGGSTVSVSANGIFYTPALKLTTPSNTLTIVTTIPLATGSDLILDLNFKARIKSGALTGHSFTACTRVVLENPSGTPALSSGTVTPTGGIIFTDDETSAALGGSNLTASYSANTITLSITGIASTTIDWVVWFSGILMPE